MTQFNFHASDNNSWFYTIRGKLREFLFEFQNLYSLMPDLSEIMMTFVVELQ